MEKLPLFDYVAGGAWGPQDAGHAADATGRRAFSCPGMGRVPVQGAEFSVFEHRLIRVAQFSLRSNIAVEPLLPHLLNPHYVRASQKNICYADASQMNGLGFPSPSIHPFHSVSSFRGNEKFFFPLDKK